MKNVAPVVPGYDLPLTMIGGEGYETIQAYRDEDGMVLCRWRLSWIERLRLLVMGNLWLYVLTFNHRFQPVKLETTRPLMGERAP